MALVCVYVRKANYFQQGKYALINRIETADDELCCAKSMNRLTSRKKRRKNFRENEQNIWLTAKDKDQLNCFKSKLAQRKFHEMIHLKGIVTR